MGEWIDTTVGDQATLQRGIDITKLEQRVGRVPVISSGGVSSYHDTPAAFGPGVILGRKGVVGSVYYVPVDYWPHDTTLWVKDFHANDPRFVYYFFQSMARRLATMDVGSANPTLNRNHVHPIRILWPASIIEQRAIASILGALDDKIDLNRSVNKTLEVMVRAIFKDWFVDFGPTRAKTESRVPYLAPEIWALFPDRLDEEGKPEGWEVKPLDQIARFLNGLPLQKYPAVGERYLPVIKIAELRAGNSVNSDRASADIPPDYVVDDGDVLFSWSGSLLHRVWTGGRGALNQHLFKVTSKQFPKWFFFNWIGHHMEEFRATAAAKATTMGHIQRHHLAAALTVVPDDRVMKTTDEFIGSLFERALINDLESRTVAQTRDLLLPKLMSGEIRVKDAEKLAETAL